MNTESKTSLSLLLQIKDGSGGQAAWRSFVDRYGSRIYQWCLNRRLQPSDAEDVCQEVLLKLARQLKTFQYDPSGSFRGWLRRLTENALNDFFQERRRHPTSQSSAGIESLSETESREDLIERLASAFDLELLDQAKTAVRGRISDHRFRAWDLTAVQGVSSAEVAGQLGMNIATVYSARHQVQQMIQAEVLKLERLVDQEVLLENSRISPKVE